MIFVLNIQKVWSTKTKFTTPKPDKQELTIMPYHSIDTIVYSNIETDTLYVFGHSTRSK